MKLKSSPHTAGFSLVEIMVGLAIGMLAVIVILQVFALSEGRKRTTTSGGDAQSNGAHDVSITA
jgi:type IV pilus assembly protein PilW